MSWLVDEKLRVDGTVHVWPQHDTVEHQGVMCICGPDLEEQANGAVLVTHHSLDGREQHEH